MTSSKYRAPKQKEEDHRVAVDHTKREDRQSDCPRRVTRVQRETDPDARDQARQQDDEQDRIENAQRPDRSGESRHHHKRTSTAPKPRWFQIAPNTLPRRICQPVSGVEVRLTQVSASRSTVTLDAAAPATAKSQKAVYQPRSDAKPMPAHLRRSDPAQPVLAKVDDSLGMCPWNSVMRTSGSVTRAIAAQVRTG